MLDLVDTGSGEWLADAPEPDWAEHPVYRSMVTAAERLRQLLALPPAARSTQEIAGLDPQQLSPGARIDLLTVLQQQQNWIAAVQSRVLAEIEAADSTALRLCQEAVSLALKIPAATAQRNLKAARTLVRELPTTLALLTRGAISGRHAEVITETAWRLDPELVSEFEARVTGRAAEQTVSQLRQSARRAELAVDPATAQQRCERAQADRSVGFRPVEDGMVQLPVLLAAPEGQLIFTRLTAAATLLPAEDSRTMDQKRADLLVDAVLSGLPHGALPQLQGRRPAIQVVVCADTLLSLDDEPAHLTGYGPITAETARRLAADESGAVCSPIRTPGSCSISALGATGQASGYVTTSALGTEFAHSLPATSPATAANTNTSLPTAKAGRPAAATARWLAAGIICARSTPAGATATTPMGPSPGPTTPAMTTPAGHPNGGLGRDQLRPELRQLHRAQSRISLRCQPKAVSSNSPPARTRPISACCALLGVSWIKRAPPATSPGSMP